MTQNEKDRLQYMIDVMQAYKDGKEIEALDVYVKKDNWELVREPLWNWADNDYRVKPEPPKPKYRPFKNAEEVMEAIKEHGLYIESMLSDNRLLIVKFNNTYIWCGASSIIRDISFYFEHNYTFSDGTPFGKLIEE